MVRQAECECPCCGWPMRVWYQAGAETLTCPTCLRAISIEESRLSKIEEPRHCDIVSKVLLLLRGVLSW
jgi:hypothetical protein